MSKFFVSIKRTGELVFGFSLKRKQHKEYFKHTKDVILGIVEADNRDDAIQKIIEYAYENDLWYSIGGKRHGKST